MVHIVLTGYIKERYWENGCFQRTNSEDSYKVCFTSRYIRHKLGAFNNTYFCGDMDCFYRDISEAIEGLDFKIISSVIDKNIMNATYSNPHEIYPLSILFIIERFCYFLSGRPRFNNKGLNIIESRGRSEDRGILNTYLQIYNNELDAEIECFLNPDEARRKLRGIYFNRKWAENSMGTRTFPGLELADLCAYPIGSHYLEHDEDRAYEIIKTKFDGYPHNPNWGKKVFP
ncbi:hypothetical protein ACFL6P_05800 [Candidatus Latescibacterota bacterium]